MSERFPRQFGKYVLLKSLARGGMGEIYLAASGQPGGLNKLVVIKKVITEKTDRAKVNRFLDEAKVVLRLSHANLVSTFDAGDVDGELFIAMELVEGKDLREIWNRCVRTRTRIPVDVALVVVREIARALAYAHTYGGLRLVHRDVAPPNILLSYFGEVKLTDFGLARSVLKQEHTAPGVVFGRASYLAPEQARGEVADGRTDVYSLGIVLWELLTGQPYLQLAGLDPVTSLSLVRNPKTQPPSTRAPWIAPELDAVVLKALAADRSLRFQSAEEMRRALSDVMTRVAPRADADRVSEFLRGLYRDVLAEENAERERLLAETLPLFRGEPLSSTSTPRTNVLSATPTALQVTGSLGGTLAWSAWSASSAPTPPPGPIAAPLPDAPKESLAVSALRARSGSYARRVPDEASGVDVPTTVWRKGSGAPGDDLVTQTFVGRVIGSRYRVRNRIGEGGMGTVYAAEHVEVGKLVAVKILHRLFSGEEELVERFRREARAASRVGHPHIIEVSEFGTTAEGCAYFVMEYLEGVDLADVLVREGRLDPARAVRIGAQICQALEAAHAGGIIHRDLKPENIFLITRDGQADFVKVLDFGIARSLSGDSWRLTNPGMAMGTPEYMAPEQVMGRPADRRTDIYAVGALLHEMLMGVAPFKSESEQMMLEFKKRSLESLRGRRSDIPAELDAIVVRALDPDPDRRPQTMAEFERALTKIVSKGHVSPSALEALLEADVDGSPSPAAITAATVPERPTPTPKRPRADTAPHGLAGSAALASDGLGPRPVLAFVPASAPVSTNPDIELAPTTKGDTPRGVRARVGVAVALGLLVMGAAAVAWTTANAPSGLLRRDLLLLGTSRVPKAPLPRVARPSPVWSPSRSIARRIAGTVTTEGARSRTDTQAVTAVPSPLPETGARPVDRPAPVDRSAPEIVPTPPVDRARAALAAGVPDDAVAVLRPYISAGNSVAKPLLGEALVASGWKDVKAYRWNTAARKAREALALADPGGSSRGAHALLGEALYAVGDFGAALAEFTKALAESPRDARLRRRVMRSADNCVTPATSAGDRRQRRPSRLPRSNRSCMASARSPSIARRPSRSGCIGASVPFCMPSKVAPSRRMVVRGLPAAAPVFPNATSNDHRRARRPSTSTSTRPDTWRKSSVSLGSRNRRSSALQPGGIKVGRFASPSKTALKSAAGCLTQRSGSAREGASTIS